MMRFLWSFSPAPPFYYQDLWGSPQNVQPVTHKRIRSHRLKGIQTRWKELSQNITFILFAGSYYQISHNKKLLTDRQKHIHARSKSRPTPMIFPKIDCCVEYHIECCALVFKISHMRKWARWVRNGSWLTPPPEGFLIKHHVFHRSGAVAALNFCSSYRRLSRSACYSSQSNAHKNDLKESEAAQPECGELRWQAGIWFSCATGGNKFFQRNSDTLIHHIAKTVYLEWSIPRDITYITATACWSSLKESLLRLLDILLLLLDNTTISIPHRNQLYLEEHRAVLVWVRRLNVDTSSLKYENIQKIKTTPHTFMFWAIIRCVSGAGSYLDTCWLQEELVTGITALRRWAACCMNCCFRARSRLASVQVSFSYR